jgi:polyphosphate kinase
VKVTVVVELQARFDEEANIFWANRMQEEGVNVIFGVSNLKVHAKLTLVRLQHGRRNEYFSIVGTGNFNENTARVYTDLFLMTGNPDVNREVRRVFNFFESNYEVGKYKHLLVAPFYLRKRIAALINREIRNANAGKPAEIFFKINNLVDRKLIKKLYLASKAGVKIRLIVRGICSLVPGLPGTSENIEVMSVVDTFLEHPRIYAFGSAGQRETYIGSADLMTRNLDYRVEVLVAILDEEVKQIIDDTMEIAWSDNVKARLLTGDLSNAYRRRKRTEAKVRSQISLYRYFQDYHDRLLGSDPDPTAQTQSTKA